MSFLVSLPPQGIVLVMRSLTCLTPTCPCDASLKWHFSIGLRLLFDDININIPICYCITAQSPPWSRSLQSCSLQPTLLRGAGEVFLKHKADHVPPLLRTPPWLPSALEGKPRLLTTAFKALLVWPPSRHPALPGSFARAIWSPHDLGNVL